MDGVSSGNQMDGVENSVMLSVSGTVSRASSGVMLSVSGTVSRASIGVMLSVSGTVSRASMGTEQRASSMATIGMVSFQRESRE